MKIGILGSRGIPNNYGGFEQFAEYVSKDLITLGYEVTVYSSHNHIYKKKKWKHVNIIHKYNPEKKIGFLGQFIYDFLCILSTHKEDFDIILQLGYTSSSIWGRLLPTKSIIVTNMDGLEWKRSKYKSYAQQFLHWAEKMAIKTSDYLIADSLCIQKYLLEKYNRTSTYISYGAIPVKSFDISLLKKYNLKQGEYYILIARIEPENNIDLILSGFIDVPDNTKKMLVVGDMKRTKHGHFLEKKYSNSRNILFTGGIYDIQVLNVLRYYASIYFHGHSVGGTNPSLLEAMASRVFIAAHDNEFNRAVIGDDGVYFKSKKNVSNIIRNDEDLNKKHYISNNVQKIKETYNWELIVKTYDKFFKSLVK